MYENDFVRQMMAQHEATTAPIRKLMAEHEAATKALFAMSPAIDLAKMFGPTTAYASVVGLTAEHLGLFGADPIANFENLMPRGLPDTVHWYESQREAEQKRQQEESDRAREAMNREARMMRDMAESRERAFDRIADKVADKLRPTFPVEKKPRIGFGEPEE